MHMYICTCMEFVFVCIVCPVSKSAASYTYMHTYIHIYTYIPIRACMNLYIHIANHRCHSGGDVCKRWYIHLHT